jgi:hypothetical protein
MLDRRATIIVHSDRDILYMIWIHAGAVAA